MKPNELQAEIDVISIHIAQSVQGDQADAISKILNLLEKLAADNRRLEDEVQKLNNEISRLKGEKGVPNIKPNKKTEDISSEKERKKAEEEANKTSNSDEKNNRRRNRTSKLENIHIDNEKICPVDLTILPNDAEFKGYDDVVIQDIIIRTNNIKYRKEVYYSASENRSYRGELPTEIKDQGEFGVGIRSLIPILKSVCNMSEAKILEFFKNVGIQISASYLSRQWTNGYDVLHEEKEAIYLSSLIHSDYQQIDDTGARVNGINHYCQVLCNPYYTIYFTTAKKDRLTILDILTNFTPRTYLYNDETQGLLDQFNLSQKIRVAIENHIEKESVLDEVNFEECLNKIQPGVNQRTRIMEACRIAAYHKQTDFPVVSCLLSDDAGQFKLLTEHHGLCWVHDGRHYKKLKPVLPCHQEALSHFLTQYWNYYTELLNYTNNPTAKSAIKLGETFDQLFSTRTNYDDLDGRIAKTLAKKIELLLVLAFPQLPLHNNAAELGARAQARVRDISFQTRSEKGTKIKDAVMTIVQTAKKLGVSSYQYIYDRVSGNLEMISLADLIQEKIQAKSAAP